MEMQSHRNGATTVHYHLQIKIFMKKNDTPTLICLWIFPVIPLPCWLSGFLLLKIFYLNKYKIWQLWRERRRFSRLFKYKLFLMWMPSTESNGNTYISTLRYHIVVGLIYFCKIDINLHKHYIETWDREKVVGNIPYLQITDNVKENRSRICKWLGHLQKKSILKIMYVTLNREFGSQIGN